MAGAAQGSGLGVSLNSQGLNVQNGRCLHLDKVCCCCLLSLPGLVGAVLGGLGVSGKGCCGAGAKGRCLGGGGSSRLGASGGLRGNLPGAARGSHGGLQGGAEEVLGGLQGVRQTGVQGCRATVGRWGMHGSSCRQKAGYVILECQQTLMGLGPCVQLPAAVSVLRCMVAQPLSASLVGPAVPMTGGRLEIQLHIRSRLSKAGRWADLGTGM